MDNSAQAIIDAAREAGEIRATDSGREFVVIPSNAQLKDLEEFRESPARQKANVQMTELDSLIGYIKIFGQTSPPRIFAAIDKMGGAAKFKAILDYHEGGKGGKAGWCEHTATFTTAQTPEWQTWLSFNRKQCGQRDFAAFIEDNIADIVEPSGAQMLEIAKTLEAKTSVDFKSGIRLENGDHQLRYVAETTGRAGGNGDVEIPSMFVLGIAPFDGGPAYKVNARLRYRINEGNLTLWYELVNPHKVIDAACKEMIATITAQTEIEPFIGK
jgi:uncharacterized protein YfdQ (DUF2303 family)